MTTGVDKPPPEVQPESEWQIRPLTPLRDDPESTRAGSGSIFRLIADLAALLPVDSRLELGAGHACLRWPS
jgi:hypothetical protein